MGIFVVLLTIERFMSKEWVDEVADVTISAVQTGGLFVVAFGIFIYDRCDAFAMIKSMITYYHFKVSYFEKTLTIERGLLEKHVQKIPLNKSARDSNQAKYIERRLLGISSVELILAGGQEQKENADNTAKVLLLPIISESELYPVLQMIYADWQMCKTNHTSCFTRMLVLFFPLVHRCAIATSNYFFFLLLVVGNDPIVGAALWHSNGLTE